MLMMKEGGPGASVRRCVRTLSRGPFIFHHSSFIISRGIFPFGCLAERYNKMTSNGSTHPC